MQNMYKGIVVLVVGVSAMVIIRIAHSGVKAVVRWIVEKNRQLKTLLTMSDLPSVVVSPSILALQSAISICKPRSIIPFALRFLQDEKTIPASALPIYHAVQMLPYLIAQPDDMRDTACSIFCALQTQPNIFNERTGALDTLPNPPAVSSSTAASGAVFREYLDGNQVSEVIQLMDLPSLGQSHPVVDEVCHVSFVLLWGSSLII